MADALRHFLQRLQLQAFLEDHGTGEGERAASHDGDVVDGPADRKRTDVSSGEEQRFHRMAVGGEHHIVHHCGVVVRFQGHLCIAFGQEGRDVLTDKLLHHLATRTVAHRDPLHDCASGRNGLNVCRRTSSIPSVIVRPAVSHMD